MGLFSSSSSAPETSPSNPPASQDGGYIAPDRTARAQCWEGRDSFFRCLDQHGIVDSVREDDKAKQMCAPELKDFEKVCAASWVTYFKKRRVMEHKRDLTMAQMDAKGAKSVDTSGAGGAATAALKGR